MKQKSFVSMVGALVVLISAVFMMTGCPTGQEPQKEKPVEPKKSFVIKYDLYDCDCDWAHLNFADPSNWELRSQEVEEGNQVTLAQDGSESRSGGEWKLEYVKHKAGKYIKGWSKNKDGSTKDYDFGQKIKPAGNMTLYPALSKYGMGDVIDGKIVIYVRNGTKDKVQTDLINRKYTEYNVVGTNWRYIAADVDAGKYSEKKRWSSTAKNIITSNGIGGGKENTEKILAAYSGDTEANNAAKYCKHISPNGYLPSEAEAFLIFEAIRGNKITGLPTFSQTTTIEVGLFSGKTAYFWTSTQSDTSEAYVINLVKDEFLYSGKVEKAKTNVGGFICPIVYYDDEGKVVK